jgi:bifunctional non-homologous end joining protein LigD
MAPLKQRLPHDRAHALAKRLAGEVAQLDPEKFIISAQANRRGRIFLDYLRMGRGTTAVGTYSPRARARLPIAAPVTWTRIEAGIQPDAFYESPFRAVPRRVDRVFIPILLS